MSRLAFFNVTMGAVAVALAWTSYMEIGPFGSPLTKACEATLKERLRSPSSYKRIAVSQQEQPLSIGEYRAIEIVRITDGPGIERLERDVERWRQDGREPVRFVQQLQYDAPNGFGALVRGSAECEHVALSGDLSGVNASNVRVDGQTSLEHLIAVARGN